MFNCIGDIGSYLAIKEPRGFLIRVVSLEAGAASEEALFGSSHYPRYFSLATCSRVQKAAILAPLIMRKQEVARLRADLSITWAPRNGCTGAEERTSHLAMSVEID